MNYQYINLKDIQKILNDEKDLWAYGERKWNSEDYKKILNYQEENKDLKGIFPLPYVFFVRNTDRIEDWLHTINELYLYNSIHQYHLLQIEEGKWIFSESELVLSPHVEKVDYCSIIKEKHTRYKFAYDLGVFDEFGENETITVLQNMNTREWRFYHE